MKADACFKLFGREIDFMVDNKERHGRLVQIRIDPHDNLIVVMSEGGLLFDYEISKVNIINKLINQNALIEQIVKRVDLKINNFKYDLTEYYKEEIIECLDLIDDMELKNKIINCFGEQENRDFCKSLYDDIRKCLNDKGKADLLCGVIAFKQHDNDEAYNVFSRRWLGDRNNDIYCRDFILVADEFDNNVLCFYLLKQLFLNKSRYLDVRYYTNFWWKCLNYSVEYNNFELLEEISITTQNARILIDSFIYVFHMYSLEHIAEKLTKCFVGKGGITQHNDGALENIQNAIKELEYCRNYLPSTAEGYYLRFESCMQSIVLNYANKDMELSGEERAGYVYEYVKSRKYGFIVGIDFQKYFCHEDDIAPSLRKRIVENIYSNRNIENEDRIYVHFRKECINKKIRATDII